MLWLVLGLYGAIVAVVAYKYRGTTSVDDFVIANRSAGSIQVGAGLFTLIGGGEFATMASLGFVYGLNGVGLFLGYALGFVFLGLVIPKIRGAAESHHFISLPDYIYHNYGVVAGFIVFLFSFCAFFALLMLQYSAASTVLASVSPVPYAAWVIIIASAILLYLLIGGLRAVLTTDVLQGICMFFLLPAVLIAAFKGLPGGNENWLGSEPLGLLGWIGFLFTGFFVAAASADVWQRAYAAKSDAAARWGFFGGALVFTVYGFGLVLIGVAAAKMGIVDSNNAFVGAILPLIGKQAILSTIVVLLLVSAISSTADTELFLLTGMIQHELRRFKVVPSGSFWTNSVGGVRLILVILSVITCAAALIFTELVDTYTWLLTALIVISPIVLFSLFKRTSKTGMVLSLVSNTALFAALAIKGTITLDNSWIIAIPGAIIYALTLLVRPTDPPKGEVPQDVSPVSEKDQRSALKVIVQLVGLCIALIFAAGNLGFDSQSFLRQTLPSISYAPRVEVVCAFFFCLHALRFWFGLNFLDADKSFVAAKAVQYPPGTPADRLRRRIDLSLQGTALLSVGLFTLSMSGKLLKEEGLALVLLIHACVIIGYDILYWKAFFKLDDEWRANVFVLVGDVVVALFAFTIGFFTIVVPWCELQSINEYATAILLILLGSFSAIFFGELSSQYLSALLANFRLLVKQ